MPETPASSGRGLSRAEYVRPPWTPEQVDALNAFQKAGRFHSFTCGGEHGSVSLVATRDGWVCPDGGCDYTQVWAHAFMLTPEAREPFGWPDNNDRSLP